MKIKIKRIYFSLLNYFAIFIRMSLIILVPLYYFGNELGELLIDKFGITTGLYIRPLVLSCLYILILLLLSNSALKKINGYIWFKKLNFEEISMIYGTYIYGLWSIALITLVIALMMLFAYSESRINWFNSKDYLGYYMLWFLIISPAICLNRISILKNS